MSSEGLVAELAKQKKPKLGLVLLVSWQDSKDCCAKNYERTLFRSHKVVEYAKKYMLPYRFDRSQGVGREIYTKYELENKKPAVLVVDTDGDLLYRTQRCTEPHLCSRGMARATLLSKAKVAYSKRSKKKLQQAGQMIEKKEYRGALNVLYRIKPSLLVRSSRAELESCYTSLEEVASQKLSVAAEREEKGDLEAAGAIYREVSRSFSRLKKIKQQAQAGLKRVAKVKRAA